ncbi:hypothetical protein LX36DRAFT_354152 [Colletotrichum falcatum]|nr:hypothetical protein LX36DRAFT_354152 [Colletotrichum falcatum]
MAYRNPVSERETCRQRCACPVRICGATWLARGLFHPVHCYLKKKKTIALCRDAQELRRRRIGGFLFSTPPHWQQNPPYARKYGALFGALPLPLSEIISQCNLTSPHSNKEVKLWRVSRASQKDAEACCSARDGQSIKQHCPSTSRSAPGPILQASHTEAKPIPPTLLPPPHPFLENARIMSCERISADRRNLAPR